MQISICLFVIIWDDRATCISGFLFEYSTLSYRIFRVALYGSLTKAPYTDLDGHMIASRDLDISGVSAIVLG